MAKKIGKKKAKTGKKKAKKKIEEALGVLDDVDLELIKFISAVVSDGRYIADLEEKPSTAARKLHRKLSRKASRRLRDLNIQKIAATVGAESAQCLPIIAIVLVLVIAFGPKRPKQSGDVVDRSNKKKL